MSNASVRISADTATSAVAIRLAERLAGEVASGHADIAVVSAPPSDPTTHVVVIGDLSDAIDAWDRDIPPQTLAGALWVAPDQDAALTAAAWWLLRSQTPTTPLSDLTDGNERCLRWSVLAAIVVPLAAPEEVSVDDEKIRKELDDLPQIQGLGKAIDRIGGESADAVLQSVEGFRTAVAALDELSDLPPAGPTPALDAAVAAHLRQVQRSGLGRWRGAKARAQSQADLVAAAKTVAADRLREVIAAREAAELAQRRAAALEETSTRTHENVALAAGDVSLPVTPDFARVPRSWSTQAPTPRRYVLIAEEHADEFAHVDGATVRASALIPQDEAWCLIIQSGFSLPALRDR
jgi:hypothetical protein